MDGIYQISLNTPMGAMNGKVTLKSNGENLNRYIGNNGNEK